VDAVLVTGYFGGYSSGEDGIAGLGPAETAAAKQIAADSLGRKPVAVQSIFPESEACRALTEAGVPVFAAVEDAAATLAVLTGTRARGLAPLPSAAAPLGPTGYTAARAVFAAAGVPFVAAREVRTAAELEAAAAELRAPYVLKALGRLHKSDGGGVLVGLPDVAALLDAHARLAAPACSVEEMADLSAGVELIVGARWDPRFGPVVLVGSGGTATEALGDVVVALGPVEEDEAHALLRGLRTAALLDEHRGRAALDVPAAARVVAAVSRFAAAHPEVAELELNPVLVTPTGAVALDARIVTQQEGQQWTSH
jgi:acetate---CoA ligase (ADP-forming)